jgi:hypothetical protein
MTKDRLRYSVYVVLLVWASLCSGQTNYFPTGVFGENAKVNTFKVEWYSKFLIAMREPSLWEASKTQTPQSYRLLWLRSFHNPVCARLDVKQDGTAVITTRIASGQGGYEPGRLTTNRTERIGRERTSWVLDRIAELNFWTLPTNPPPNPDVVGVDGAQWIFEGVKDGTYHMVDRWSPDKGEVHSLGIMMLLDLANLKLLYQEIY